MGSSRGILRRRAGTSVPRKLRPLGEPLEPRTLLTAASNPFDTPQFQKGLATAIGRQNAPDGTVASIAFIRDGQLFTAESPGISSDALFRVGSVSKAFAAAAVMELVQDGKLGLDASAMSVLGYARDRAVSGYDPVTLKPVGTPPAPGLFDITVEQLLNMTSGLPNSVTIASRTYPKAAPDLPLYNAGSYAALAFAGRPPYQQPATAEQQWNYAVYEISAYMNNHPALAHQNATPNALSPPGSTRVRPATRTVGSRTAPCRATRRSSTATPTARSWRSRSTTTCSKPIRPRKMHSRASWTRSKAW
jgi:CubicO group peptidase (beta-lactamase class C family)